VNTGQVAVAGKVTVGLSHTTIIRHKLCGKSPNGLSGLRKGDEHPSYTHVRSKVPFTFFRCMKHYHGSVIADILDCDYDRISDLLLLRHNFVQVCFTVGVLMLVFINTGWGKLNQAMSHCESKKMPIISLNADRFSAFFHLQTRCIWTPGCNVLFIHLLILTPYCLKLPKSQTGGKGIVKTCTTTRKGMTLNKNIGRKSLHHFVQRLLV